MTDQEQLAMYRHKLLRLAALTAGNEIAGLKAQVNCLRDALEKIAKLGNGKHYGNSIGNTMAIEALAATPEQCLAEVKAKAIEDAIAEVTKQGVGMQINVTPYFYDYRVLKFTNELKDQANLLREQAK